MRSLRFLLSLFNRKLCLLSALSVTAGWLGHTLALFSVLSALIGLSGRIEIPLAASLAVVFGLLRAPAKYAEQYLNHYIAFTLLAAARRTLFRKLCDLAPQRLEGKKKGELISSLTSDIETLEIFYAHTVSPLFIAALNGITVFFIVGVFSWALAGVWLFGYLLICLPIPLISYLCRRNDGREIREAEAGFAAFYLDRLLSASQTVYSGREKSETQSVAEESGALRSILYKSKIKDGHSTAFGDAAVSIVMLAVFAFGLYLTVGGFLPPAEATIALGACVSAFAPAISLKNLPYALTSTFASAQRLRKITEEKPEIIYPADGERLEKITEAGIEDVSFSYDGERKILEEATLSLPSSGITALVGSSGIGKSTVLKLLLRYHDPSGGAVKFNEKDVRELSIDDLREKVALMGQRTALFHESIRANMKEATPEAEDRKIWEALKKAGIDSFVRNLPQGLDTVFTPEDPNFSSGQCQRLGLARIFLRDPDLILLDEPTSNVDRLSEKAMMDSIKELSETKAVLLVTHRSFSSEYADRRYILEDKKIHKM